MHPYKHAIYGQWSCPKCRVSWNGLLQHSKIFRIIGPGHVEYPIKLCPVSITVISHRESRQDLFLIACITIVTKLTPGETFLHDDQTKHKIY